MHDQLFDQGTYHIFGTNDGTILPPHAAKCITQLYKLVGNNTDYLKVVVVVA